MAVNYEHVQEKDGTFTIKDVEVAAKGTWRPAGAPAAGFNMSAQRLGDILDADAKIRQFVQPVVRDAHASKDGSGGGWIGALGPLKRIGDKIVADLRGLSEAVFQAITSGAAGRISPELRLGWTEPSTKETFRTILTGIAFVGGAMPAITNLKPIVSFETDDNNGEAIALIAEGFVDTDIPALVSENLSIRHSPGSKIFLELV